jgi:8-oxo-dGTP pyrophosphatase MutT (NUDIX family)
VTVPRPSHPLHEDAVGVLTRWTAPDAAQEELREHYLRHLSLYADGLWRDRLPEHVTASAVVLSRDGARVLLHLHGKVGRWLQFGGHCEPRDWSLAAAAYRETIEESGLPRVELDGVPVQLSRHRVRCSGTTAYHLDVQFLTVAPDGAVPVRSAESHDLRWYAVNELPADADEAVVSLVARSRDRLHTRQNWKDSAYEA